MRTGVVNEYETALAAHVDETSSKGVTDVCFSEGWIAALQAVRAATGTWATGGLIDRLARQAVTAESSESSRCVKCGGPDGFHDPACIVHPESADLGSENG